MTQQIQKYENSNKFLSPRDFIFCGYMTPGKRRAWFITNFLTGTGGLISGAMLNSHLCMGLSFSLFLLGLAIVLFLPSKK